MFFRYIFIIILLNFYYSLTDQDSYLKNLMIQDAIRSGLNFYPPMVGPSTEFCEDPLPDSPLSPIFGDIQL